MNESDFQKILSGPPPAEDSAETHNSAANGVEEAADVGAKVVSSTVPSGYTIHYCPDPRWYRIGGEDWETATEVPSVTTVLDVLSKPALTWWGQRIGVEGVASLWTHENKDIAEGVGRHLLEGNSDAIVDMLKEQKITVNHRRDKAASRGTSVHSALESWAVTGQIANVDDFPEEEQGYVRGLNAFLADCKGELEALDAELMVGSKEHGFAGRFDLRGHVSAVREFKTGPRTTRVIPPGIGIFDLKTSKGVYDSHYLQLAAYRLGLEESGYGRSDFEAVILVNADGKYDVRLNPRRPEHFLAVKRAHDALAH